MMTLYEDQFSPDHDFPRVERPEKYLVLATTRRCGSHMLGHLLYDTGYFGFPLEYVQADNLARWRRLLGKRRIEEVMTELTRRRTSPNGVFAIKLHYHHLAAFGRFRRFTALFPGARYLLLKRRDLVRQAVSLSIAKQSGVWIDGQPPRKTARYRPGLIARCLRQTVRHNAAWRYLLASQGCPCLELTFEEARESPRTALKTIAEFMGVDPPDEVLERISFPTREQATDRNREWTRRFLAEQGDQPLFPYARWGMWERLKDSGRRLLGR